MEGEIYMQEKHHEKLRGFLKHGVVFSGITGNQAFGYCPFSEKEDKLYVNVDTLLWDSKTANISGNFSKFLTEISKLRTKTITSSDFEELSKDRGLPVSAFKGYGMGFLNGMYTLPIKNEKGYVIDIKCFEIGKKLMSTPTCNTGLFGLDKMMKENKSGNVYICEGEWDAIALSWLFKYTKTAGTVVGVPGALTFKQEWAYFFRNRNVIVLYDNDEAGENGEHVVYSKLNGIAKSIKFVHWLDKFPIGFDLRDFIRLEAVKNNRPKRCLDKVMQMIKSYPRKEFTAAVTQQTKFNKPLPPIDPDMNWEKYCGIIRHWFKVEDFNAHLMALAVITSNFLPGDAVWVFMVASPGVGKTEILGSFKYCEDVFITSSITPNALISGAVATKNGQDPSLLPKLNGKSLVVKDFAAIQTMRDTDRDALMGILRDAYDGSATKVFGTGETKAYESKFSFLAGVTPSIYQLDHQFSALGERFLKFFMGDFLEHKNQISVIQQALDNVGQEDQMREEVAAATRSYVENIKSFIRSPNFVMPVLNKDTEWKIAHLAAWVARMKGVVSMDKFQKDVMLNKAYSEVGTRTGKQLKTIMLRFPTLLFRGHETDLEYILIKKLALDTVSARREDLFRCVYNKCKHPDDSIDVGTICHETKYSLSTVYRTIEDLVALNILEKIGIKKPSRYMPSKTMRELTEISGLYEDPLTKNRVSRGKMLDPQETRQKLRSAQRVTIRK